MARVREDLTKPLPQPEPGLDGETMIARAAALRPKIYEQQAENDWRGYYSDELHERFRKAGFYRILQPKMFGGYELEPEIFIRVIMEISRAHPAAGWCFTLAASHGYLLASYWPEDAEREIFGPDGEFLAAFPGIPAGTIERADGGYIVSGTWPFASGIPVSTHLMAGVLLPKGDGQEQSIILVPREKITILPDWGKDQYMGMQASGSNTVKLENVFVPDRHIVGTMPDMSSEMAPKGTPGTRLHGNPMYLAVRGGWFNTEFAAILSGTARAALDEFLTLAKTKRVLIRPQEKMMQDSTVQEVYGRALGLADAAEALTIDAVRLYTEQYRRFASDGTPVTVKDTFKVWGLANQAGRMACEAVEILFHASGGSSGRRDKRLHRYFQDITTYRLHPQSQPFIPAVRAQTEFGIATTLFGASAPAPKA